VSATLKVVIEAEGAEPATAEAAEAPAA
jgi:hypothetical protein